MADAKAQRNSCTRSWFEKATQREPLDLQDSLRPEVEVSRCETRNSKASQGLEPAERAERAARTKEAEGAVHGMDQHVGHHPAGP